VAREAEVVDEVAAISQVPARAASAFVQTVVRKFLIRPDNAASTLPARNAVLKWFVISARTHNPKINPPVKHGRVAISRIGCL
jgi:hypothetical protein